MDKKHISEMAEMMKGKKPTLILKKKAKPTLILKKKAPAKKANYKRVG